ncbi:TIGR01906 family membrane protein [Streptococcus oricebi]|uniref:TIGR01906 family membrane protein n=1 Tax=Streptococcus oricebi TaxID=1547447 RepID=A0ABS5B0M0_9STRE|nr:TIGR01906 family membrane protein [Streptococcus oricebi]MBP2622373.1 TIGR01906 family membrane protein [Streptococcus oricebi]
MRNRLIFSTSILWLLATAILLTIYLAWLLYPWEISHLQLADQLPLAPGRIQHNFNILLDYLTNPFSQRLAMPDFPSSPAGLHHFAAVKGLFHLAQLVFVLTLPSLYFSYREIIKKGFLPFYQRSILALMALPFALALVGFFIGFNQFFTLFHQLLFVGDSTWLFDPARDPVILILPEEFFLHAFLLFFALYQGLLALLYFKSRKKVS